MLLTEEIRELIESGETSRVEFKSEREKNIDFAKEIAAFTNGSGGYLLVGVENDGTVSGVSDPLKFEEKIYNICSDFTRPVVTPELWKYKIEGKAGGDWSADLSASGGQRRQRKAIHELHEFTRNSKTKIGDNSCNSWIKKRVYEFYEMHEMKRKR